MVARRCVLALDVSGSRTLLRRVAYDGALGEAAEVPNDGREAATYWADVLVAAEGLAAIGPVDGAGMAFGGPVDDAGRILSIHVGGWHELDPAAALSDRLGVPVVLENDANCGALGEFHFGGHAGARTLIFMTCSTGIGGGILQEGRLYHGARGLAGELGHMPIVPHGRPCPCGSRGCLEAHCSGSAIAARATERLEVSPRRSLLRPGPVEGAKPVFDAAGRGDALAIELLDEVFAEFGRGIAAIHNALDPTVILIGGGVSLAGAALTEPVAAAARPLVMAHRREHLRLEAATLGLDAQLLGAAALAIATVRADDGAGSKPVS